MKAKVKVKLYEDQFSKWLYIKLKLDGEKLYWHKDTVVSANKYNVNGSYIGDKTDTEFYSEVIDFISDKNNIKKAGEELLKDVLKNRIEESENNFNEKKVKELLKKLKEPIEIEVIN